MGDSMSENEYELRSVIDELKLKYISASERRDKERRSGNFAGAETAGFIITEIQAMLLGRYAELREFYKSQGRTGDAFSVSLNELELAVQELKERI